MESAQKNYLRMATKLSQMARGDPSRAEVLDRLAKLLRQLAKVKGSQAKRRLPEPWIDPPSDFHLPKRWEQYLAELRALPQNTVGLGQRLRHARWGLAYSREWSQLAGS